MSSSSRDVVYSITVLSIEKCATGGNHSISSKANAGSIVDSLHEEAGRFKPNQPRQI